MDSPDYNTDGLPLNDDDTVDHLALGRQIFDRPAPQPVVIALADLGGDVAEARELAADASVYRELVQQAIGEMARLTAQLTRATDTIRALRDELRRYTASQVTERRAA